MILTPYHGPLLNYSQLRNTWNLRHSSVTLGPFRSYLDDDCVDSHKPSIFELRKIAPTHPCQHFHSSCLPMKQCSSSTSLIHLEQLFGNMMVFKYLEGSDSVHRLWEGLCRSTVSGSVVFGGMCNFFPHGVRYCLLSNHVVSGFFAIHIWLSIRKYNLFSPYDIDKEHPIPQVWAPILLMVHIPSMRIRGTKLPESL
jgi:hypothetical protein